METSHVRAATAATQEGEEQPARPAAERAAGSASRSDVEDHVSGVERLIGKLVASIGDPWTFEDARGDILSRVRALAAELADAVKERDEWALQTTDDAATLRARAAEAEAARGEVQEYRDLFDLHWQAVQRGTSLWREAHPDRALTVPDHADLVAWLLEQIHTFEKCKSDALAAARAERDEARDFANRWIRAAMYATPVTTMAFDPTNPEAFAESRRHALDELLARAERERGEAGWNAALEWAAGWIEAGYPTRGDMADPHALAVTLRAGRKPLRWDVLVWYRSIYGSGVLIHEAEVEAVDELTACEIAEAALMGGGEVSQVDDVRATLASTPATPGGVR